MIPSLPGFTFSSGPPLDANFTGVDTARVINKVMVNLGFEDGYVAQGGDIGSRIGRILAVDHEPCKAVHCKLPIASSLQMLHLIIISECVLYGQALQRTRHGYY